MGRRKVIIVDDDRDTREMLTLALSLEGYDVSEAANGLRLSSQIMTDKVNPLRRDRIRRVIGSLDTESTERLNSALLVVLGLAR